MKMKIPTDDHYSTTQESTNSYILSDQSDSSSGSDETDPPTLDGDFSEYMWMENEEEFEKQVMQQLEEEALMEECYEAMLADEREISLENASQEFENSGIQWSHQTSDNSPELIETMNRLHIRDLALKSTLNPNAAEFIPQRTRVSADNP